jgi:G:T/U mismatch-specific DNA glycosylase
MEIRHFVHAFEPVKDENSKILILGSVPSLKSVERGFYYMHPQNRFWPLMSALFGKDFVIVGREGKTKLLLSLHIALYDSIRECDIYGSSDLKAFNLVPTDLKKLIEGTKIEKIFCNGTLSYNVAYKNNSEVRGIIKKLPSTSPANASFNLNRLSDAWKEIILA